VEGVFNLPDLLQPTPDRPKARVTVISRTCIFMNEFFPIRFAGSLVASQSQANYKKQEK
jgi:hypothetical protein